MVHLDHVSRFLDNDQETGWKLSACSGHYTVHFVVHAEAAFGFHPQHASGRD
jgi:hypothetical protein